MNIKYIFHILIATLLAISVGFSAQSFSINADLNDGTQSTNVDRTLSIEVVNTGNESITIDFSEEDATDGANSLTLSLSSSSVTLSEGESQTIDLTYNTQSEEGTFTGSVVVENSENNTQSEAISFSVTVEIPTVNEASFVLIGDVISGNVITFTEVEIDETTRFDSIEIVNNGNVMLTNIKYDMDNLEGDEDDIDDSDVEVENRDINDFEIDELDVGESRDSDFRFDIGNIDVDSYRGDLTITARDPNNNVITQVYRIEVETFSDEEEIEFTNSNPIKVNEEPGNTINDLELEIKNSGANTVEGLILEIEDEFTQESGSNVLPISAFSFSEPGRFTLDEDDEIEIDLDITIPEDLAQGTYSGDIRILNRDDEELDEIRVEIKVTGDVYIQSITLPESIKPDEILDLEITLANQGNQVFRDVRIEAIINDIDVAQSDLDQTTDTFLLDVNDEITKRLRFIIPEDAQDGQKAIEITVTYDNGDQEITEIESIRIDREPYFINVQSYSVSPNVIKCDSSIYASIRVENLGQYDDEVAITSEIVGTGIQSTTNEIDLNTDDDYSFRNVLDVSNLEAGTYEVVHTIRSKDQKEVSNTIRVQDCASQGNTGIEFEDLNNTGINSGNETSNSTIELFGEDFENTTVYLGAGLVFISLLIIVSLFML